jgi:hypothetical protein
MSPTAETVTLSVHAVQSCPRREGGREIRIRTAGAKRGNRAIFRIGFITVDNVRRIWIIFNGDVRVIETHFSSTFYAERQITSGRLQASRRSKILIRIFQRKLDITHRKKKILDFYSFAVYHIFD